MEKMKKIFIILVMISTLIFSNVVLADVGDFESYDSDWGSDWDSDWGSDWDSDWDYGYSGSYGSYDSGGIGAVGITMIILFIIFIAIAKSSRTTQSSTGRSYPNTRPVQNYNRPAYVRNQIRSEAVADEVRKVDKYFNDEQFLSFVKNIFIKLQNAWSERDWEAIRTIESEDLYEQHAKQVQGYIQRKQINKMERICVNFAELVSFNQDNEKDILVVALNSSMLDYIVDEATGRVLKGSKDNRLTNTYKLTFIRKKGIVTETGTEELKTTNCPNCGAPTKITSSGKCEFCGSVITIGAHDWVLGDMERY